MASATAFFGLTTTVVGEKRLPKPNFETHKLLPLESRNLAHSGGANDFESSSKVAIWLSASLTTSVQEMVWFMLFELQVVVADVVIVLLPPNSTP